jgi:hypothetical protein
VSRAKAVAPAFADVVARLKSLEKQFERFESSTAETRDEFFTLCFHQATLQQVLFLRTRLKWRSDDIDCFIAALTLGCLHGESHRTEWCLSNRMPRTISTKPATPFAGEERDVTAVRDVFAVLNLARFRYESPFPNSRPGVRATLDAHLAAAAIPRPREI